METIGVIDDDEDSNALLRVLLGSRYNVHAFEKWEDAEEPFKKDPPAVILLDISMPNMSGEKVLQRIREVKPLQGTAVIALTGYALPEDREKYLQLGFDGYLSKPITDRGALFEMIDKVLI